MIRLLFTLYVGHLSLTDTIDYLYIGDEHVAVYSLSSMVRLPAQFWNRSPLSLGIPLPSQQTAGLNITLKALNLW